MIPVTTNHEWKQNVITGWTLELRRTAYQLSPATLLCCTALRRTLLRPHPPARACTRSTRPAPGTLHRWCKRRALCLHHPATCLVDGSAVLCGSLRRWRAMTAPAACRRCWEGTRQVIPPEYHKWVRMSIDYACKLVAVTFAWWLQRIVSAVHRCAASHHQPSPRTVALAAQSGLTVHPSCGA